MGGGGEKTKMQSAFAFSSNMTRSPLLVDYQRQQELLPIEFLFFFSGTQFLGISLFETSNMIYRLDSLCLDNYSLN